MIYKKFPNRTMNDIDRNIDDMSFIVYAYLYKDFKFKHPFNKTTVHFDSSSVNRFTANNHDQKENVKNLKYFDDNKFIVKRVLQNDQDEIFFVRGYDMKSPVSALEAILKYDEEDLKSLNSSDIFGAPFASFDYTKHYNDLEGRCFANKGWADYCIDQMIEQIEFNLNEKEAKVEAEAKMVAVVAASGEDHKTKKVRKSVLNKPFWIILKRKNSNIPYFIIGVNNTSILSVK